MISGIAASLPEDVWNVAMTLQAWNPSTIVAESASKFTSGRCTIRTV